MRSVLLVVAIGIAVFTTPVEAQPFTAQVDFGKTTQANWPPPPAGWNRVDENGVVWWPNSIQADGRLREPNGTLTDIALTVPNSFDYTWDNGRNEELTAANGVVFPSFSNFGTQGVVITVADVGATNGAVRLTSPTLYEYTLTFAATWLNSGSADTLLNVGGTWDQINSDFIGGNTIALKTSEYPVETNLTGILTALPTWNGTNWVLDIGVGNSAGSGNAPLSAMHISAAVPQVQSVPEPTSVALWSLIGLGLAGFGYCRLRRKK